MEQTPAAPRTDGSADYDTPWKEALESYFRSFLALFFPAAHDGIDWEKGHEFLDKELEKVVRDAELGRRLADKLVRVWRKDGEEELVLIHVEVQGQRSGDFAKRMYVYNYRLFDRYDRKVASLAVLADENPGWRPDRYEYELWGCRAGVSFPMVKLLDLAARWGQLQESRNPFASVVMAHLKAMETARDPQARRRWKWELVKGLHERGFGRSDILELFRFIDWLMALPQELDRQFWQELRDFEEERKMPYVTSVERIGIEQGLQKGLESERRLLVRQVRTRFGAECSAEGESVLQQVHELERLEQVGEWLLECASGAELLERMRALVGSGK